MAPPDTLTPPADTVAPPDTLAPPRRGRFVLPIRIAVSAAMLALLLPRLRPASLVPAWTLGTAAWLVGALAATAAGIVLSAIRWRQVLSALGMQARTRTLLSHCLAGLFVGNFLPSTIGGDVLRVTRLSRDNGERPGTFASVVLERLTGWLVLPVITIFGLVINPELADLGVASDIALALSLGTLALLGGVVVAAASPRVGGRIGSNAGWRRFVAAVHVGLERFRHHPGAAAGVLAVGLAYQLAVVLAAFLAARALGIPVGPTAILAFMPAVAIAQVLPISLGGLGIREGAFVLFLHPLGVATGDAVALGLLVYGLNLVVSLLGAPAFALGHRSHSARVLA